MRITTLLLVVLATGCGKKDETSKQSAPPPVDKPADKPADPPPPPPPVAAPQCKLEITGAETRTIEGPGGLSAATTSYWFKPDDKNLRMMWPDDNAGFILNCIGKGASVNITTKDMTKAAFKLGPKKFELGENQSKNELAILGSIEKSSVMGARGTVEITAFDTTHIAGKVDLAAKLLPGDGEIKIVGEFDFKCPSGMSGCGQ